jgi:hypothetical protein
MDVKYKIKKAKKNTSVVFPLSTSIFKKKRGMVSQII